MIDKLLKLADRTAARLVPTTTAAATSQWCNVPKCSPDGGLVFYWCDGTSSSNCTCGTAVCADHVG